MTGKRVGLYAGFRVLLVLCYWYTLTCGVVMTTIGPSLQPVSNTFHVSLATAGQLFLAQMIPYIAGVLAAGIASDMIGRRPIALMTMLLYAVGMGLFVLSPSWPVLLLGMGLWGVAFGAGDGVFLAAVSDLNAHRRGFAINLVLVVNGTGALVGPAIMGLILSHGSSWRWPFAAAAISGAAILIALLPVRFPRPESTERISASAAAQLLRQPDLVLLSAQMFLYLGIEVGIFGWMASYLSQQRGMPVGIASLSVSLYWAGLIGGRLAFLRYVEMVGYLRLVSICILGLLFSLAFALAVQQGWIALIGFVAAGFFCSIIWPTVLASGGQRFPQWPGTVNGILIASSSAGGGIVSWLLGMVAARTSLRTGLAMLVVVATVMVLIQIPLMRRMRAQGYR